MTLVEAFPSYVFWVIIVPIIVIPLVLWLLTVMAKALLVVAVVGGGAVLYSYLTDDPEASS